MSEVSVRQVAPVARGALLEMLAAPGAALLEGWSDDGRLTIALPWPDELRSLGWHELERADMFLSDIVDSCDRSLARAELPFAGGWVGFLSYEVGAAWEGALPREDLPDEPAAWFVRHEAGYVQLADGRAFVFAPEARIGETCEHMTAVVDLDRRCELSDATLDDSMGRGAYQQAVEDIRERISWGDVYQVNLTRRFVVDAAVDPLALYLGMTGDEPPRCSALLRGEGWSVASASPEVFLRFDPYERRADSRPIKGTVRRTGDGAADEAAMRGSAKDEAEHLMIVDLVRNDLGKVAPPGNVDVAEYKAIRTLRHVLHLESIVEARGVDPGDLVRLIRALFPAGSITGAPKRSAVSAIREIEPCARGVYTGAIGLIDHRGYAEMSVAIRTAVIGEGRCRYHAGGGIVWDSDPDAEDRESYAKSIGFLETLGLETK